VPSLSVAACFPHRDSVASAVARREIVIVDASAEHIETSKAFLDGDIEFEHRKFDIHKTENADLLVIRCHLSAIEARFIAIRLPLRYWSMTGSGTAADGAFWCPCCC